MTYDQSIHVLQMIRIMIRYIWSHNERYKNVHNSGLDAWNYVIKALNARYLVNRNTNPKIARIMKADQRQISKEYKLAKQPVNTHSKQ